MRKAGAGGTVARLRKHLNPSFFISLVALFVALGGVSYAALKLPANSVGSRQLAGSSVTGAKLANNSVTAAKVKDGTLTSADIHSGVLPTNDEIATSGHQPMPTSRSDASEVFSTTRQPGTYLISEAVEAYKATGSAGDLFVFRCQLDNGVADATNFPGLVMDGVVADGPNTKINLVGTLVLRSASKIALACWQTDGTPPISRISVWNTRGTITYLGSPPPAPR